MWKIIKVCFLKIFRYECEIVISLSREYTAEMASLYWDDSLMSLIARFMGPSWGLSGADRTQVGPMLAPWNLLSGVCYRKPIVCPSGKDIVCVIVSWRSYICLLLCFSYCFIEAWISNCIPQYSVGCNYLPMAYLYIDVLWLGYRTWNNNYLFYPRPVLAFRYCRCLPPSFRPFVTKFVRGITHQLFKLGSPNLDQRCKTPWLRSL